MILVSEKAGQVLRSSEQAIDAPFDLKVNGAFEDEVRLGLHLLKVTGLADPVLLIHLVVCLNPKPVRSYPELSERDPESMHPVSVRVLGSDNEPLP